MSNLYFRQLLAGRDFAEEDPAARQMENFVYLIGDAARREAVVVDPAWDIEGILAQLEKDDMKLTGVLATHYHPDHVGGHIFGHDIQGLSELIGRVPVPVHVNAHEADGVRQVTGLSSSDLHLVEGGDTLTVGEVPIRLLHTPGHTPGSQCFLVDEERLVSGDTLFIGACGRVDLPGGDPEAMYRSLSQLSQLDDRVVLFPGHDYGDRPFKPMALEKQTNPYLKAASLQQFLHARGVM
jgi:glyoxylase-like metal-dependent hydrolase (beta-lactamase superfamily II)